MGSKFETQVQRLEARSTVERGSLSTEFQRRVDAVLEELRAKRWMPVIFHGRRTEKQQQEKVAAGVSPTLKSWHVASTRKSVQTNGIYWDVRGEAADIVDARYLWSGPAADLDYSFWKDLGTAAKRQGLEWGGDWKKRDVAHVQLIVRSTSQDARNRLA